MAATVGRKERLCQTTGNAASTVSVDFYDARQNVHTCSPAFLPGWAKVTPREVGMVAAIPIERSRNQLPRRAMTKGATLCTGRPLFLERLTTCDSRLYLPPSASMPRRTLPKRSTNKLGANPFGPSPSEAKANLRAEPLPGNTELTWQASGITTSVTGQGRPQTEPKPNGPALCQ